jgi:hypothetical protein
MTYPRIREAPESSSAAVLQAVAASLADAWRPPQRTTSTQAKLAHLATRLPDALKRKLVSYAVRDIGLDPALAARVTSEGLARQALGVYNQVKGGIGYPAILIGTPNGGVAYLASLLQIPFLPSHFLLSFADHSNPDDIQGYARQGSAFLEPIITQNPDLLAVNHYDPLHDRFLVEHVNHIRLKLLDLPQVYRDFIREHLAPEGVVFFVDSHYAWSQYQLGERHFLQVGGLGGYNDQDFFHGNPEIDKWLATQKSRQHGGWNLDDQYPLLEQPESEWGGQPAFRDAVHHFCEAEPYQFFAINGAHPEDFSALAYTAYLWESRLHERTPRGILIESFSLLNPTAALRSDLLPLWLPFNCDDSLEYLARMISVFPSDAPLLLALLPGFTVTPDMPGAEAWQQVASRQGQVTWIGAEPRHYPIDPSALFDYLPELQTWVQNNPGTSPRPHLTPDDLQEMMRYLGRWGSELFTLLLDTPGASDAGPSPHQPAAPTTGAAQEPPV